MSRTSAIQRRRAPLVIGISLLVVLSLVVLACVVFSRDRAPEPSPAPSPPKAETSASGASTLTLPDDAEAVSFRFEASGEQPVLLELSVTATFTASTGEERALYAIVGMSCGSIDGPTNTQSVNGTENLIHQTTRQVNQLLSYDAETPGEHSCNAKINAPSWDPEYGDAELSLEATIRLVAPDGATYHYGTAATDHPIVLEPGEKVAAVDKTFPLTAGPAGALDVRSGTHLTSCTITNGSRDQTKANLCTEPQVDREGSTVTTRTVVQQLRGDKVCRTVTADRSISTIDHLVHHRLLDSSTRIEGFLSDPCGDSLRVLHEVANEGPAALVVHRGSTKVATIAR